MLVKPRRTASGEKKCREELEYGGKELPEKTEIRMNRLELPRIVQLSKRLDPPASPNNTMLELENYAL